MPYNKPYFLTYQHWSVLSQGDQADITKHFPSIDAVFNTNADIISKNSQSEVFAYAIGEKTYYIKRFFRSVGIASWLGFSRFKIETRNQLWFNQMNLPSAKVVAYGEERFLFKCVRGVIITEGIPHTQDLAYIAKENPAQFQNTAWTRKLIQQAAEVLRFFHLNRFCHNDLHWRNILVQAGSSKDECQLFLIDCPLGRRLFWPFLNYKKYKDLANIDKLAPRYLSRTQRLRFFLKYRNITKLEAADKAFIRNIFKHKANRLKRKARENKLK